MDITQIRDKLGLIDYINHGHQVKYLFFWGHQPKQDGGVGKTCFSQWYEAGFQLDGVHYKTAEHYMMAEKARLFDDLKIRSQILDAQHPGEAKKLGRQVRGFQQEVWTQERFGIVVKGNVAKFSQNDLLREYLLTTGERVLVEASPVDRIWGIGLAANDPNAENPYEWKGLNLLGFALMEVREVILRSLRNDL